MADLHSSRSSSRDNLLTFFLAHLLIVMPLVYVAMWATVTYGDAKIAAAEVQK